MGKLADKEAIYQELYDSLAHFMGRQHLVVQAVVDQGVDPDRLLGVSGWYDRTPQTGRWRSDWKFWFHGGGCQITHTSTGEPIDWNGPDPYSFDPFGFVRHLEWRIANEPGLPLIRIFVEKRGTVLAVAELVKDLVADGIISPNYHLTAATVPASSA